VTEIVNRTLCFALQPDGPVKTRLLANLLTKQNNSKSKPTSFSSNHLCFSFTFKCKCRKGYSYHDQMLPHYVQSPLFQTGLQPSF